jgi:hypothetical protein
MAFFEPLTEGKPKRTDQNPISQKEMGFCFCGRKWLLVMNSRVEARNCGIVKNKDSTLFIPKQIDSEGAVIAL